MLCLLLFNPLSISLTWSINPILSISSASSIIKYFIFDVSKDPLSMWSITLPGVPTTIWVLCFNSLAWSEKGCFPNTATGLTLLNLPMLIISSLTWIASSLVGVKTRAWGFCSSQFIFSHKGIPKAAVFPLPVCDLTITSLPCSNSGITLCCTSDGSLYPKASKAFNISSLIL